MLVGVLPRSEVRVGRSGIVQIRARVCAQITFINPDVRLRSARCQSVSLEGHVVRRVMLEGRTGVRVVRYVCDLYPTRRGQVPDTSGTSTGHETVGENTHNFPKYLCMVLYPLELSS